MPAWRAPRMPRRDDLACRALRPGDGCERLSRVRAARRRHLSGTLAAHACRRAARSRCPCPLLVSARVRPLWALQGATPGEGEAKPWPPAAYEFDKSCTGLGLAVVLDADPRRRAVCGAVAHRQDDCPRIAKGRAPGRRQAAALRSHVEDGRAGTAGAFERARPGAATNSSGRTCTKRCYARSRLRRMRPTASDHARSKRSRFITLSQAATKSRMNASCASLHA
ncbi:MAG: hypothetical protein AW08_03887 [Candidatus Accumulibacter adjunctus]|uniref:Uncharacterized protein n=1 Tax=Candidatus Accumulibacter adjunctus TaxID=1454001 RepID=A0A011MMT8_9PROT|nr:MAG: hypothetical protein AW08_03887 [Candidatus Accumulibacter adjunctus]